MSLDHTSFQPPRPRFWPLALLLVVALTGYLSGYLMKKAGNRSRGGL